MLLFNIEVPDLLPGVDRVSVGDVNSLDDVFRAFGKITLICNEWEKKYKEYANLKELDVTDKSSLAHIHRKLEKIIDKKVYDSVMNVIDVRAHFEHEFLYSLFNYDKNSLRDGGTQIAYDYKNIKTVLDLCYNLFMEGIDYVSNLIDELDLSGNYHPHRPTIFD